MPRLFSYLLGVWLLLSQLPREIPGQSTNDFIKACGRELVRLWVEICGSVSWGRTALSLEEPQLETGPPAETMPSSITKDAEILKMMLEFVPNLPQELKATLSERQPSLRELQQSASKDSNLNFEEFKKIILNRQNEAEDKSLLELKNLGLDKHSRKKRLFRMTLSEKCCQVGCIRKDIARLC
ncbi:prorelaxin precursor [Sus scrofa]|uniref:Prorelaxin n=1 Tax=Sus scrofa TaxID=9823 RepID=RELX_PIG|nr:prorelaxin precursor [Sus scrofa]P01348.1 RecName: Full=Prorelaxin; Contains: RecName: Full=Relaxin B chain; Contains: RecName: Full=Relaxin A chain; Flags: Precursor [Sus scrofa]AAA31114.1 preprorelaxin [Sus scrofa]